jgi:hypothetical protein
MPNSNTAVKIIKRLRLSTNDVSAITARVITVIASHDIWNPGTRFKNRIALISMLDQIGTFHQNALSQRKHVVGGIICGMHDLSVLVSSQLWIARIRVAEAP